MVAFMNNVNNNDVMKYQMYDVTVVKFGVNWDLFPKYQWSKL